MPGDILNGGGGREEIFAGGVLGAIAVAEAAAGIAVCPVCIIGAPLFLGLGAFKTVRNRLAGKSIQAVDRQ